MTLRFNWTWEPAPEVRIPELAATWAQLSIDLDGTLATLVERRDGSGGPKRFLDVPTYPLAEWLATNWWQLNATSHLPRDTGVRISQAAAGFAWPDLTLRNDRGLMWASLRQRDKAPEHIRYLTQAETVLDADSVLASIGNFIDETVRSLDDAGVTGTLLQEEWAAINQADPDEREFCLVAASWGHDPYDTPPEVEMLLLEAATSVGDIALLSDLSRAVPIDRIKDATHWLREAETVLRPQHLDLPTVGRIDWSATSGIAPWKIGYERASRLRQLLGLTPDAKIPVEQLPDVRPTSSAAPSNVDALLSSDGASSPGGYARRPGNSSCSPSP